MKKIINSILGLSALNLTFSILLFFIFFSLKSSTSVDNPFKEELSKKINPQLKKLYDEQKYNEAVDKIKDLKEEAFKKSDVSFYTYYLIEQFKLESSLHAYETALKNFYNAKKTEHPLAKIILKLYETNALNNYLQSYSYEIMKREKITEKEEDDFDKYTKEELIFKIREAYLEIYKDREKIEDVSLEALPDFLDSGSYPKEVLSNFRDFVGCSLSTLFSSDQFFSPIESRTKYKLKVSNLLDSKFLSSNFEKNVFSKDSHPLLVAITVLNEEEKNAFSRNRKKTAIEFHIRKLQIIFENFEQKDDRFKVINEFNEFLENNRDVEWYSVGMAELAGFERALGDEDCNIRAREIAIKGKNAYPNSVGAQRCNHLLNQIEERDFNIETMHSDGTNLPSIRVTYKNLEKLYIRLIPIDVKEIIYKHNQLPRWRELFRIIKDIPPVKKFDVNLKNTPDYNFHNQYLKIPSDVPKGTYVCVASAVDSLKENNNKIEGCFLTITEIALFISEENKGGQIELATLNGKNGNPISDVDLTIIRTEWNKAPLIVFSGKSDSFGKAKIEKLKLSYSYNYYIFAAKEKDTSFMNIHPIYDVSEGFDLNSSLIFTDRAVYRVGQKILFKVIVFRKTQEKGPFSLVKDSMINVELKDPNQETVEKISLKTNSFGSASGEFLIPKGRMLGRWQIISIFGGQSSILVEEYKRPTFEVEIKEPVSPLRLNFETKIKGEAKYYFGMPLTSGSVDYTVTRIPRFPWWCWWYSSFSKPEIIDSGNTAVDENGSFTITFLPEADERLKDTKGITYTYAINVNVTDEGGETRRDEKKFNIGFTTLEPSISLEKIFYLPNEKTNFVFELKDLNGNPQIGKGTFSIYSLEPFKDTPLPENFTLKKERTKYSFDDDFIKPRWEKPEDYEKFLSELKTSTLIKKGEVTFDKEGKFTLSHSPLPYGIYRIKIEVKDSFGQIAEDYRDFFVLEDGKSLYLPIVLMSDKKSYEVNETAKIVFYSGYKDCDLIATFSDKRGIIKKERIKGGEVKIVEHLVTDESRGGIVIDASLVKNYTFLSERIVLSIPYTNKELKIKFEKIREKITPNVKEFWKLKIVKPSGQISNDKTIEVLASMYDKSLDLFAKHNFPSFMGMFPQSYYPVQPQTSFLMGENLFTFENNFYKFTTYPTFNEPSLKSISGYGIGGPGIRGYSSSILIKSAPEESISGGIAPSAPSPKVKSKEMLLAAVDKIPETKEGISKQVEAESSTKIRENFAETPFFYPHLLVESDGSLSIEFIPPDSLTKYRFMVFAHGEGIVSGKNEKDIEAIKDFMVRPYLPRFLREGDEISIKVMVNNTFEKDIESNLNLKIIDSESGKDITSLFSLNTASKTVKVRSKKSETASFSLKIPHKIQQVKFEVTGKYQNFTDGERREIPILPSRIHLAESKFVTLKENDTREVVFDELLKQLDKTRINEKLVLTVDAQLLYSVLEAMPYLVEYPYECTEQLANKFFTVGILNKIIKDNPSLEKFAREFSSRETKYEKFYGDDPNRRMLLEETPWLVESKGGHEENPIIPILNPDVSKMVETTSLKKLLDAQYPSGGFPWWAGGEPSPYITLYIVYSFSKAAEFGVDVPVENIRRAFNYLKNEGLKQDIQICIQKDVGLEFVTFLNYVLSNFDTPYYYEHDFPKSLREKMADFSFKHWKEHSPYLKLQLALTLKRMGRDRDALLVHESVFDSAVTRKDEGTFWMIEDKSWLWYNDTVETQAFALKEIMEINPKDQKSEGLLLWLFLNKKLNHWKSTKATSEALYSILSYLKSKGAIGVKESVKIKVGDTFEQELLYDPEKYTGKKNQIVFEGDDIKPQFGKIEFSKQGKGFAFASATLHFSTEELPKESKGDLFTIERTFYKRLKKGNEFILEQLTKDSTLQIGDQIEVELKIKSKHPAEYIHIRAPRPSGCEPEKLRSGWVFSLGFYYYEAVRDSAEDIFLEYIPKGEFKLRYRLRCQQRGLFKVAPATIQSMYAPEFVAYSSGKEVKIEERR